MRLRRIDVSTERREGTKPGGELLLGDARALIPDLTARYAGEAQAVYLDPPFTTGREMTMRARVGAKEWASGLGSLPLVAYRDNMDEAEYLAMMKTVLEGARALLREDGLLFLHCDWRASPRLRDLMDEVFGANRFLNEIIWAYQSGGRATRFFSRKHDTILLYAKSAAYAFHLDSVPLSRETTRANHLRRHVDADGRAYRTITTRGKTYTYYDDAPTYPSDVWTDVSHLQQKDPQRTGYETQKPVALLERVIRCSTRPGDLVCDLFAGSGTTLVAAHKNGRRFLGADASPLAFQTARARLMGAEATFKAPPSEGEARIELNARRSVGYYELTLSGYDPGLARPDGAPFSPLSAVNGWSVGYLEDGAFLARADETRSRRTPTLTGRLQLMMLPGEACVRVSDVFGRSFYYVLEDES